MNKLKSIYNLQNKKVEKKLIKAYEIFKEPIHNLIKKMI